MNGQADRIEHDDPRNAAVLAWLSAGERLPSYIASGPRGSVDEWQLGAHPDLVSRLWDELDAGLPKRCAWIVHGRAALVRPKTGIVFGLALSTAGVALRVPLERHAELGVDATQRVHRVRDRIVLELAVLGPEWAFDPYGPRGVSWARAAFEAAL